MTQEQCVNCWGLAIINKNSLLSIFAGDKALSRIKSSGLNASDIKVVAGAAGGPKWLVLHGLDQFFFGQWLTNTDSPIHLIGSSIGAWRYAAYCRTDFKKSFKQFEDVYFSQQYTKKPDKQEITEQLDQILDCIFSDAGVDEILSNKHFKLNLFADRGKGLLNREHPAFLIPGLLLTTACNYFSRQTLELFFRRTLFHHPDSLPPFYHMNDFATDTVALSHENLRLAVLASGAIPLVVNGVNNIPDAKPGYYRDGGLIDYHMSIPYGVDEGIVLLPHFSKTIYPGWLDKFAGTVGIGLIGIAGGLNLSLEITAGAIISGAYFGDKMSPLSDTTNLAPAVTGTDLFAHIRHMTWTTMPSLLIALVIFIFIGFDNEASQEVSSLDETLSILQSEFYISWVLLLPLLLVLFMAMKKVPALATIFIGALIGGVFGVIFQPERIIASVNNPELSNFAALLQGTWKAMADGYVSNTGNGVIDDLLSRGGMSSMLVTLWLIMTAMAFGSVMERVGMLQRVVKSILSLVHSTGSLIAATVGTCIGANIITSDQYIAIVIPGKMYQLEYQKRGLDPRNLSRVLEDSGTITSPLIPWNTCGAFMAGTLGVATFAYLPFCFFNLINPVISVIYGYTGFKLIPLKDENNSELAEEIA